MDDDETFRETIILAPRIRTVNGAHVGMTGGEIKAIYGDRVRLETKRNRRDYKFYTDGGDVASTPVGTGDT